jgi:hypothetical protein
MPCPLGNGHLASSGFRDCNPGKKAGHAWKWAIGALPERRTMMLKTFLLEA